MNNRTKSRFHVGQEIAAQYHTSDDVRTYKRVMTIKSIAKSSGNLTIGGYGAIRPNAVGHGRYFSDDDKDIEEAKNFVIKYRRRKTKKKPEQKTHVQKMVEIQNHFDEFIEKCKKLKEADHAENT